MASKYQLGDVSYTLTRNGLEGVISNIQPDRNNPGPAVNCEHEEYTADGYHIVTGWDVGEPEPYVTIDNAQPPIEQ